MRLVQRPLCAACHQQLLRAPILKNAANQGKRFVVLGSPLSEGISNRARKIVGGWLLGTAGMVFGAVTVGGLTRLTESGLSMVHWNLIKGMKPPLSQTEWENEFEKYKQYSEYQFKNSDREMTLGEFKFIWSLEYLHRMWGRAIGLAFFIPAGIFWSLKWFTPAMKKRVGLAGGLLLFQGFLGWYMVKSGLDPSKNSRDIPSVSQYRLAAHLSSAVVLYTVLLWTGLSHLLTPFNHNNIPRIGTLRGLAHGSKTVMFLAIVMGAFVAGMDAGLVYNSWPKYADKWVPESGDLWAKSPKWKNFTENPSMVQFVHRNLGYTALALVTATWFIGRKMPLHPRAKLALHAMFVMGYVQVALGVFTLIHYVPTWLASLHQNGSMTLIGFTFWLTNELRRVPK